MCDSASFYPAIVVLLLNDLRLGGLDGQSTVCKRMALSRVLAAASIAWQLISRPCIVGRRRWLPRCLLRWVESCEPAIGGAGASTCITLSAMVLGQAASVATRQVSMPTLPLLVSCGDAGGPLLLMVVPAMSMVHSINFDYFACQLLGLLSGIWGRLEGYGLPLSMQFRLKPRSHWV